MRALLAVMTTEKKTWIITGAGRGMGVDFAKAALAAGHNVVATGRDPDAVAKALGDSDDLLVVKLDVTSSDDARAAVEAATDRFGGVDVLVNNAGGPRAGGFDALDDAAWQEAFELNLLSGVRLIRGVLPHMRQQKWGRIVTIASSSIKQPIPNLLLSNTYRVAILGLAKSLAVEFAPDGVLINTVGPGRIATERTAQLDETTAQKAGVPIEEVRAQTERNIPLGRYGTTEEFAKVLAFVVSGANTYLTGQHFLVDGAMVKAI